MLHAVAQAQSYTEEDYYNLPETVRAELIDGQFYAMAAPSRIHQELSGELYLMIGNYLKKSGGACRIFSAPFAVKLFDDHKHIVEPDISIICDRSKLTDSGCSGAPDWIIEIVSPGNPGHDYVRKLNLYMDAGVREYWIVDPKKQTVLVYYFEKTAFDVRQYTFQERIKVNIYDDLWIDLREIELS